MINARQEKKVSRELSHTLFLHSLPSVSVYIYFFFSLFEENFLNVSNQNEDELLNLMLKSSACRRTEKEKAIEGNTKKLITFIVNNET